MRSALITGISSGIGFHLSLQLIDQGWTVTGILRNRQRFEQSLAESGRNLPAAAALRLIEADIDHEQELATALSREAAPDVLVNNAGYGLYGPFEELSDEQMKAQFETNLFSPLRLIRRFLPEMRERRYGRIVNISSILGQISLPTGSAYCSSKWALEAATEALRAEVAPFGIDVCLVEPGLIRTNFKQNMKLNATLNNDDSPYRFLNRLIGRELQQYGRFATSPEDAARSIVRLLRKRHLPVRYRVGADATFYYLMKKMIPGSVLDAARKSYIQNLYSKD